MNCDEFENLISAYVDGELLQFDAQRVENHVADCPRCAATLTEYRKMAGEMKGNLEQWREMYRNRELFQDKAMTKDMNQVQNRLEKAANELDEMLKVMERLANRLKLNG